MKQSMNHKNMNEHFYKIIKTTIILLSLVVLYLFALNGRYTFVLKGTVCFDKWTNKTEHISSIGERSTSQKQKQSPTIPSSQEEDKKWLYRKLKSKGYGIGSYDEFNQSLANDEDRKWYYDKAVKMKLDVGTYDDFNSLFGNQMSASQKQEQQKVKAMPVNDKLVREIYETLKKDNYDLGDYDNFCTAIQNESARRNLYDTMMSDNYDLGDYETFNANIMGSTVSATPQPTQQQPVQQ